MATGDMKARLLLDSKDFEKNIKKSKRNAKDFGDSVTQTSTGANGSIQRMLAAFSKAGPYIAAAGSAAAVGMKAFNAAMQSSQQLSDTFARNMEASKGALDNFVYSIANADFSSFNGGLDKMIERLKGAYDAYDQLTNTMMSAKFANTLDQTRFKEAMTVARNKELSTEERMAAVETARGYATTIAATAMKVEADAMSALQSMFSAKAGLPAAAFTKELIEGAFRVDVSPYSTEERADIEQRYEDYLALRERAGYVQPMMREMYRQKYGHNYDWRVASKADERNYEALRPLAEAETAKTIARLDKEYVEVVTKYIALYRLKDKELGDAMEVFTSGAQARNMAAEQMNAVNEVYTTLNNEAAAAKKAEIEAARKSAEAAQKSAAAAEEYAEMLLTMPWDTGRALANADRALAGGKWAVPTLPDYAGAVPTGKGVAAPKLPGAFANWHRRLELTASPVTESIPDVKEVDVWIEGLEALDGAFGALGNTVGGVAGEMLTFVDNALKAAEATVQLISYILAEAAAHKQNAAEAATEAAAKAMSAHAGIPFAGIGLGLAAVTAIMTAIQSIPKFADGGIVTSATLGVFGEAGPEAVLPLDKLKDYIGGNEVRVTGNIKASGKELVVVLDNYNRVRSVR